MRFHQTMSAPGQKPWFLNPALLFCSAWLGVWFLYSLRLSNLLMFSRGVVSRIEIPLLLTFLPVYFLTYFLPNSLYQATPRWSPVRAGFVLEKRLNLWLKIWIVMTLVEIVFSGGIPLIWSLTGSSKTYFDFGIPSLHGLLNALILSICLTRFALGIKFNRKKDLLYPLYIIVWSLIIETRQEVIIVVLETAIIFLSYRKLQIKRIAILLIVAFLAIIVFGISGDIRSGGDSFRQLAQPSDRYPGWLPSGFLWAYMYATTPLNNLVNTYVHVAPLNDIHLPNTLALLVPTVLSSANRDTAFGGDLVTQAFNVSTAFIGPVQDFGMAGIIGFACFVALITGIFWRKHGLRNNLVYAVLMQCLILTIFFDHFLYLPIIFQTVWLYFLFRGTGGEVEEVPSHHQA